MKRLKLMGLVLVALCLAAIAMATTAAALPTVLPSATSSRTWTGKSTSQIELQGAETIQCQSATGEGAEEPSTTKALGTFKLDIKECSTEVLKVKVTCTGLGESTGITLESGSWHIVYDSLSPLGAAILYLLGAVHFECSTTLVTVPLGSMVLCLWKELRKALTHEFNCRASGTKGKPELSKYYNEAGTLVSISPLLSSVNEGTASEYASVHAGSVSYNEEVEIMA